MSEPSGGDWPRILAENALVRARRDRRRLDEHVAMARAATRRITDRLALEAGVRRVILFGSLAPGGIVHDRSDIDIAVEGLPRDRESAVWREIRDLAGMPVDLLRFEDLPIAFRDRIETEGEVLFVAE